ncbi:hypothetical protein [Mucilaginibacter sp.]|uniref:hypothetical protein n=1 Tax=Mucilaginibacter sp. TaxID=1882438 RepID=UPI002616C3E3|nr:hypothetical protein [Mucilaginibacter sp.]MDB4926328.1 hypothetical protein [Mucilaginibacter sp.]
MKALKLTLIVSLLVIAISCKKTGSSTATVTADDAADMAAGSVAQNSFGFSSVTDNVGVNAQTLYSVSSGGQAVNAVGATSTTSHQACGTTVADSLTGSGNSSSVTYSFFYKYVRTLTCNTASQPDNLLNVVTFHGNYDGPRLTSADAGTANVTVAGLTPNATNYAVNGTYTRKGTFTSKVGAKATGTSTIEIKATNVLLSKSDRTIISGTATVTISGTTGGSTFSYTGTLVFNGSNKATLTVGTTNYVINLLTGAYVK